MGVRLAQRHDSWDYVRGSYCESLPTIIRHILLIPSVPSFMRLVQTELEMPMKSRAGVCGRIKEFVGAISVVGQIEHHRCRVNELRSNFVVRSS
jgi:hypothetical protein